MLLNARVRHIRPVITEDDMRKVKLLAISMEQTGQMMPITVVRDEPWWRAWWTGRWYLCVDGQHRLAAARRLLFSRILVNLVDLPEGQSPTELARQYQGL